MLSESSIYDEFYSSPKILACAKRQIINFRQEYLTKRYNLIINTENIPQDCRGILMIDGTRSELRLAPAIKFSLCFRLPRHSFRRISRMEYELNVDECRELRYDAKDYATVKEANLGSNDLQNFIKELGTRWNIAKIDILDFSKIEALFNQRRIML